jgi:asparagine synthase (glutamine-hydrolysing)
MCRIFGYISDGVDRLDHKISGVSDAQVHGGPDSQRIFATPEYGIGCNRLAITDPNGGLQPYNGLPGIYAVLNGEIYNHNDLRRELEADGYHFKDRCDGSILPALYEKYGASFPEYLDGMFTIAMLDIRQGKPKIVLASDTSGIKPVYFTHKSGSDSFAFATEIPALLGFGIATGSIWQPGVDHFLTTRSVTGLRTLLNDVYSLPPGSILQKSPGEEPLISTYASRITYDGPIPQNLDEASEIFRELLAREVRNLSIADAKICSIASGGLDSSLVTSLLCRASGNQVSSFHVAVDGKWPFDERVYARELADAYGLDYHETLVRPKEIPELFKKMAYHLGQPNCAPHALSTYRLFEAVSQHGFRVALTGEGSDELFCGHERMGLAIHDRGSNWASNYLDRMSPCTELTRWSLYSSEYANKLKNQGEVAKDEMAKILYASDDNRSSAIRNFEQRFSLPYYILHRVEPLAMASGVEVRVPFCQPRIMDFSWKIDPALFFANGDRGKAVAYGAAEGLVPRSILDRPKQPFTLPIIKLMQKGSPFMDFIKDSLCSRRMREDGIFDPKGLSRLVERQETSPSKESSFTLWALANYAVWADMIAESVKPSFGVTSRPRQNTTTLNQQGFGLVP